VRKCGEMVFKGADMQATTTRERGGASSSKLRTAKGAPLPGSQSTETNIKGRRRIGNSWEPLHRGLFWEAYELTAVAELWRSRAAAGQSQAPPKLLFPRHRSRTVQNGVSHETLFRY
jgi:hypothetical protein